MAIKQNPDFQLAKNNLKWMQDEKQKAGNYLLILKQDFHENLV